MTIFLVFVEQKHESCALPEQKITCYSDSLPICTLLNRILVFGLISWEKRTIASWKNSLKNWLYWSSTNYFRFKYHSRLRQITLIPVIGEFVQFSLTYISRSSDNIIKWNTTVLLCIIGLTFSIELKKFYLRIIICQWSFVEIK